MGQSTEIRVLHPRIRLVFRTITLMLALAVLACTYLCILPFTTGFDPCLSTLIARNDITAIRIRYENFYSLIKEMKYEDAYQFTSPKFRGEYDFEEFKDRANWVFGMGPEFTEINAESTIGVCGDSAHISISGDKGWIGYGAFFNLVRLGGQWYFDDINYAPD